MFSARILPQGCSAGAEKASEPYVVYGECFFREVLRNGDKDSNINILKTKKRRKAFFYK